MRIFSYKTGKFNLSDKKIVMGIVNVTPDSFSDGGLFLDSDNAVSRTRKLFSEGADMIDLGAMSTRPGSESVTVKEEIDRLAPVLEKLKNDDIVISVDTINPETAEYCMLNGADIINDVSGVFNKDMAEIIKKYHAGWIMTHTCNVPSGSVVDYPDGVVAAVNEFFDDFLQKCDDYGINRECICIDPGFGFAKTTCDNIELLKNLEKTVRDDVAHMTALSRKRFIGEITGTSDAADRLCGTLAADMIALMKNTDMLRVHDVNETVQTIAIYNSIK